MILLWIGFVAFVLLMLALDLGVLNRKAHVVSTREALGFTTLVVVLALAFGVFVYFAYDHHWFGLGATVDHVDRAINDGRLAAVKFLTGYIVEVSLSADNVFVIALIFGHFRIPTKFQHRVLFWGILGALVMRGAMIGLGAQLVARYHWVLYVFGAFLLYTAVQMLRARDAAAAPQDSLLIRRLRGVLPVTDRYDDDRFATRIDGRLVLTPLALALVLVESTDLLFAVDSIPAIFAITSDPFLVFTSNVFAILGLRSLYFVLASALEKFRYLKLSLAAILGIVGAKMLTTEPLQDLVGPTLNFWLLGVVALVLLAGIAASIRWTRQEERRRTAEVAATTERSER